jgi:hypothetical protein
MTSFLLLSMKTDVNVLLKRNKQKTLFVRVLSATHEKTGSGSASHWYGSLIRIRLKMSRIHNTDSPILLVRVVDPYSFFTDPDPDPVDPDGGQYGYGSGSGSNPDPGL